MAVWDVLLVGACLFAIWLLFFRRRLASALTVFSRGKLSRWQAAMAWLVSFLLFVTIWDIASRLEPEGINKIPGPVQTVAAAGRLLASGKLLSEAGISCLRVLVGFSAASVVGVAVGLLSG